MCARKRDLVKKYMRVSVTKHALSHQLVTVRRHSTNIYTHIDVYEIMPILLFSGKFC